MMHYVIGGLKEKNNIEIIIFLYSFSGIVGLVKMSGGIKGFVDFVSKKVKKKSGALLLTWLTTLGTFSDPDFRIVTIAPL